MSLALSDDRLYRHLKSIIFFARSNFIAFFIPDELYEVPAGLIALLSVCYGSISVLAVVGNALVMWIVATSRRMQSVTNCFIANLALADIVIGLFAIPFQVKESKLIDTPYNNA